MHRCSHMEEELTQAVDFCGLVIRQCPESFDTFTCQLQGEFVDQWAGILLRVETSHDEAIL